jgi:dolichol kinase
MDEIFMEFFTDSLMAVLLFILILSTVIMTRRFKNIWVNRKLIHLSVTPAVLSYMYLFKEPYVFFLFGILFAFFLVVPHFRSMEFKWFQKKNNFGEVLFCSSVAVLGLLLWSPLTRILAGTAMLFMAIGDSITGMVRSRFLKKRAKHWSGTLAMVLTCVPIGYLFLGLTGILLATVATLAEYQPWLDDNISVPFATVLVGFFFV